MHVRVRLFAVLRERAGSAELELELPDGARVGDALEELRWLTGEIPVVMAVNRIYADAERPLATGDELALIPPVSGGAPSEPVPHEPLPPEPRVHARVTDAPLSLDRLVALVRDARAGATVTFTGTTRDVPLLEYEAYAEMAEAMLREIAATALARHGLCAAAVEHRIGTVALSEASIAIAVSAPHRAEAFAGAREILDTAKAQAPIWKKEEGEWVRGSVPGG